MVVASTPISCPKCMNVFTCGGKRSLRFFELRFTCVFSDAPPNLLYFMKSSSVLSKILTFDYNFTPAELSLLLLSLNYESLGKEKIENIDECYYKPFETIKRGERISRFFDNFFKNIANGNYESIVYDGPITEKEDQKKCFEVCKEADKFKTLIRTKNVYCYPLKASSFAIRPTVTKSGAKSIILYSVLFLCNLEENLKGKMMEGKKRKEGEEKEEKEKEEKEKEEKEEEGGGGEEKGEDFPYCIIYTMDDDLLCSNIIFLEDNFCDDYGSEQTLIKFLNNLNSINIFSFRESSSSIPLIFKKVISKNEKYSLLRLILKNSKFKTLSKTSLSFRFASTEFQNSKLTSIHRSILTNNLIDHFILFFYSH